MILVEELHRLFDLIVDKTASPYFTSNEKDDFLNRGIMALVNKYFNPTPSHLMEATSIDVTDLMELIPTPIILSSSSVGDVTFTDIDTALSDRKFMYILNIARRSGCDAEWVKCRFVRHNDYFPQISNSFKKLYQKNTKKSWKSWTPSSHVQHHITISCIKPPCLP